MSIVGYFMIKDIWTPRRCKFSLRLPLTIIANLLTLPFYGDHGNRDVDGDMHVLRTDLDGIATRMP